MSTDPLHHYPRSEVAAGAAHFRHVLAGATPTPKESKRAIRENEAESREHIGEELDAAIADTRNALARVAGQRGAEDNLATRKIVQAQLPMQYRALGFVR